MSCHSPQFRCISSPFAHPQGDSQLAVAQFLGDAGVKPGRRHPFDHLPIGESQPDMGVVAPQFLAVVRREISHQQPPTGHERSEEHTSELQSLMRISYAVYCLKKKTTIPIETNIIVERSARK